MRGLLTLLGGALVTFLIVGYYFNWYSISFSKGTDGKTHIETDLDTKKVTDDLNKGVQKIDKAIHSGSNPSAPTAPPSK